MSETAARFVCRQVWAMKLEWEVGLVMNQEKSRGVNYDGVELLSFIFNGVRGTIQVSPKSQKRFKHQMRQITGRSRGISIEDRLSRLRSYVRDWMG